MKKYILVFSLFIFVLFSCDSSKDTGKMNHQLKPKMEEKSTQQVEVESPTNGLELMKKQCFICHFPKPDYSKHDQMIAPPMLRVQEHYLPNYPEKTDFVDAILEWTKNPTEENTLMPGALRKFKLMPKLGYKDEDVKIIAAYLYDMDFGDSPKMNHNSELSLNNGKKWRIKKETSQKVAAVYLKLNNFKTEDISAYNQLGKDIFDSIKSILIGDDYKDEIYEQLQNFFHQVEGNMHQLIETKSIEEAQKQLNILIEKFDTFNNFFN